ncbi:hypothetical protein GCM10023196_057460 [Actinoallomurus vinaceus]|uniref:Peptidase S1 domain-containing protein n=1 Tax=Actinoallomurus vinaceus TaxID=1080074 RepID=A0ABP8UFF5_9ACTN
MSVCASVLLSIGPARAAISTASPPTPTASAPVTATTTKPPVQKPKTQRPGASSPASVPAPTATPGNGKPSRDDGATLREDEKYWTAERMAKAVPVDAQRGTASAAHRRLAPPPPGTETGTYYGGIPQVGTFFFNAPETGDTHCTGSVVHSDKHDLVLTAGHCGVGIARAAHAIFVPQYRYPKTVADQPHGVFPVKKTYLDPRYQANTKAAVSDLDLAFIRVGANDKGNAENVVGALTFTPTTSFNHNVRVIGYPGSHNSQHQALYCDVATSRLSGFRQMKMLCNGFYGGVSGGPWIEDGNKVIGNVGGYNGGGNDANDDWITYAPIYGKDAVDLYNDANADRAPGPKPPYNPPGDSPKLPGGGGLWKHAKLMASGDFSGTGHSDLLVIWSDGEVTLYPGDGKGGFQPERQLLAPSELWTHPETITGGDFAGGNQFDLLVRWSDGEVTLYPDVGTLGLNNDGTQMAPKGSVWKDAVQIAAGRFVADSYVTDLVVRWTDGELTLYGRVGAGTFGQETQLEPPNGTWRNATLLTSGQFAGNQKWDLMVRWVDGELDNYVGTNASGLGTEQRIYDPNKLWTHDEVMSTGGYTANGLADDLIIRWSDGETTMYVDTRANRIGTEVMLVPPE